MKYHYYPLVEAAMNATPEEFDAFVRSEGYVKLDIDPQPLVALHHLAAAKLPAAEAKEGLVALSHVIDALDGARACPHGYPWMHAHCCPPSERTG